MLDKLLQSPRTIWASRQARFLLPYLFLALLLALGGAFLVSNRLVREAQRQFDDSLAAAAGRGADLIVREEERLLETLRLVANTRDLWEVVGRGDTGALRAMVYPLAFNSDQDLVAILDLDGTSLLTLQRLPESSAVGYQATLGSVQFGNLFFVRRILVGQQDSLGDKFTEIAEVDAQTTLLIAGPVRDRDGLLAGVVVVGRSLAGLAVDLARETGYPANLYRLNGQLLAGPLPGQASLDTAIAKEVIENQVGMGYLRTFNLQDRRYREIVSVFELRDKQDYGLMGLAADTASLSNTTRQIRFQVFAYALLLFALSLAAGVVMAWIIAQKAQVPAFQVSQGDWSAVSQPAAADPRSPALKPLPVASGDLESTRMLLLQACDQSLEGWAMSLDLRNREGHGHTQRVCDLAVRLAQELGMGGESLQHIWRGALLHDIGTVGVPDTILHKPGSLTAEEFEMVKKHPEYAYNLLSEIPFLQEAIDIPYSHHEKWDGSGYPQGLEKTDIPIAARIFAVVDVWVAVTSRRVYRPAMDQEAALRILKEGSGTHFDPMVVDAFLQRVLPTISEG